MNLQESGEMYLETILILSGKKQFVRSVDISEYMGYSKPSVSRAVGLLKNAAYIVVDREGYITLTDLRAAHRPYGAAAPPGRGGEAGGGRCLQDGARDQRRDLHRPHGRFEKE